MINFYSANESVAYDFLMDHGFQLAIYDSKTSIHLWIRSIRKSHNGTVEHRPRQGLNIWTFHVPDAPRDRSMVYYVVNTRTTEVLFKELQTELDNPNTRNRAWSIKCETYEELDVAIA